MQNEFGYKQELDPTMGKFSSFAVSFSLISVLTGIFANFNFGYQQVGGAVVLMWLIVAVGQLFVALVMANLAMRFPVTGYGYQWASRLVNTDMGFFAGWMLLIQFLTGFPGICKTFTETLTSFMGFTFSQHIASLITVIVIFLVTVIHLSGIKWVARINDMGVYAELAGVFIIILLLAGAWMLQDQVDVSQIENAGEQLARSSGSLGSFALSLLLGAWCLTGFEAAADMAEETKNPSRNVPRAVVFSLIISSIAGFLVLAFLVVHAQDINAAKGNLLITILLEKLGVRLTFWVVMFVLISIFACAIASMAAASRLLFSFARDRILPFSPWISKVESQSKSPKNAILLIAALSSIAIIALRRVEIITSVSALATYLGNAGILVAALAGKPNHETYIYSVKWQRTIQVIALSWVFLVVLALSVPETIMDGFETRHLPAVTASVSIVAGVILYFFYVRSKIKNGTAGPPKSKN